MPLTGVSTAVPGPGTVLGGKYLIRELLGEGGMAFVFEGFHQRLGQRVALKVLHTDFARDAEIIARFEREARALALLRSRHVARVTDVDATLDGLPYIVMEYLDGQDLDAELQQRGQIPLEEAVDYVLQACAAMAEAHGVNIVHRDLKPANLFLAEDNGERVVKVLDFGISKVVGEATRLTGSGAVMGTVLYMSPEQVRASADIDTRADIWSLGMILYELVAGRAPWEGGSHQIAAAIVSTDAQDIRAFVAVPEPFAAAIRTALMRDRNQRFASVRDLAMALAPFAPKGSLGAAIAEQLATGSNPRMRPSYASMSGAVRSTAPMMPSLGPISGPHPSLANVPQPPAPTSGPSTFVVIGAVLGVLAAIGAVLLFIAIGVRRQSRATASAPTTTAASDPVATSEPAPSSTAAVTAAASSDTMPLPPSTGIATSDTTPSTSASTSASVRKASPPPTATPKAGAPSATTPAPGKSGEPPPYL